MFIVLYIPSSSRSPESKTTSSLLTMSWHKLPLELRLMVMNHLHPWLHLSVHPSCRLSFVQLSINLVEFEPWILQELECIYDHLAELHTWQRHGRSALSSGPDWHSCQRPERNRNTWSQKLSYFHKAWTSSIHIFEKEKSAPALSTKLIDFQSVPKDRLSALSVRYGWRA